MKRGNLLKPTRLIGMLSAPHGKSITISGLSDGVAFAIELVMALAGLQQ